MEQGFGDGEWIADKVLATLGQVSQTATQETAVTATSRIPGLNALSPGGIGPMPSGTIRTIQSAMGQLVKANDGSNQMNMASNISQKSSVAGPPTGPRGFSRSCTDTGLAFRPRAPPLMPIEQQEPLSQQGVHSWGNDTTTPPVQQFHRSPHDMYGVQARGSQFNGQMEASPSMPRAMQTPAPVSFENNKNNIGGGLSVMPNLKRADLAKWPCRRCLFVHKGSNCEASCLGCGTKSPLEHNSNCPYRSKNRPEESALVPVSVKMEPKSFKDTRSSFSNSKDMRSAPSAASREMRPGLQSVPKDKRSTFKYASKDNRSSFPAASPGMSSTMKLSLECQKRGFNPEFQYYSVTDGDNNHQADLWIRNFLISGAGQNFNSQKDARDALAIKGLEKLREIENAGSVNSAAAPNLSFGSRGFSGGPLEHRITQANPESSVKGPASLQQKAASNTIVTLPRNINPRQVRGAIQNAVAGVPNGNISLHLPANVSVEVAQAYGRAIGSIAPTSVRGRSRSPLREVSREYRTREPHAREHFQDRRRDRQRERGRERDQRAPRTDRYIPPSPYARRSPDSYRPDARSEPFLPKMHFRPELYARATPRPDFHARPEPRPGFHARPEPYARSMPRLDFHAHPDNRQGAYARTDPREIRDFPRQRFEGSRLRPSPPREARYQSPFERGDRETQDRSSHR